MMKSCNLEPKPLLGTQEARKSKRTINEGRLVNEEIGPFFIQHFSFILLFSRIPVLLLRRVFGRLSVR